MTLRQAKNNGDTTIVITRIPTKQHTMIAVSAAELRIPRNELYAALLDYCLMCSGMSIDQMYSLSKNTKG